MKLIEALDIIQGSKPGGLPPFSALLCCSFTPLHLLTFLKAHLHLALPGRNVRIDTGLYGDIFGTLERAGKEKSDAVLATLEWFDIDPRLGTRQLGGWDPPVLDDILREAEERTSRLRSQLTSIAAARPLVVSMPTLPLPPVAFTPSYQASPIEERLREQAARLAGALASSPGASVVHSRELDRLSPPGLRHDVRSELLSGFPYQLGHADTLAGLLAKLVARPTPKKGLITDLDDTLWRGIAGDDGPDGVAWDLDHKAHAHGVYQQMLRSLARTGVLVGVATKNNPEVVEAVFRRHDLIVRRDDLYPVEIDWGPKSEPVRRILKAWNVAADSVVFIDDSPIEIDEVRQAHHGLECIEFPKNDPDAVYQLCYRLRDLFGKSEVREEDRIRSASLRAAARLERAAAASGARLDKFLGNSEAVISYSYWKDPPDPRALELINKTNQFNLNGRRYTEGEWRSYVDRPETRLVLVQYRDKYGPLGKIAVLAGRLNGERFVLDTWVMSCRAFTRRIEHHSLNELFGHFGVHEIELDFRPTERNGPARDFLASMAGEIAEGPVTISRALFQKRCPPLQHATEPANG